MKLSSIGSINHTGLNDRRTKEKIKEALIMEFGIDANDEIDNAIIQNYRRIVNNNQEFNDQLKAMKEIIKWNYNVKQLGYNAPPVKLQIENPQIRSHNLLRSTRLMRGPTPKQINGPSWQNGLNVDENNRTHILSRQDGIYSSLENNRTYDETQIMNKQNSIDEAMRRDLTPNPNIKRYMPVIPK